MKVYLDNGATTKVDPKVMKAMQGYFTQDFGNASSLHQYGRKAKGALNWARRVIAQRINAKPEEMVFTSGGTEADNLAIRGAAYANQGRGNHIITSKIEHPAVLNTCKALEKEGFRVTYLDVDRQGFIDMEQLKNEINDQTILVSIIHGNNEIGTIQNLDKIAKLCKKHQAVFHSDAVQSFTKVPIDVSNTPVDLLSFSSHKIHGPKGVGALFIRKGTNIKKQQEGGSHEFGVRAGTENIPGVVGFAKAVQLMKEPELQKMTQLRDRLINSLKKSISSCQLNGPEGNSRLCNNVNFVFNFVEGEAVLLRLDAQGVAVSTGSACSQRDLKPSHVLTAIGLRPDIAHGSIRFTLSKYTTAQEIDYAVKAVKQVVEGLRKISPLRRGQNE